MEETTGGCSGACEGWRTELWGEEEREEASGGGGVRVGGVRGGSLGVRAADGVGPLMETELLPTVDNPGTTRTKITKNFHFLCHWYKSINISNIDYHCQCKCDVNKQLMQIQYTYMYLLFSELMTL